VRKQASINSERIKRLLLTDRMNAGDDFIEALNNDLCAVLSNYAELIDGTLETDVASAGDCCYVIEIRAKATRVKSVGLIK
jgi:septum formation topological specificity factor MinE